MLRQIEGIDKIKVVLSPVFLNPDSRKKHIDPRNKLTLHRAGAFLALSIHAEFYNPMIDFQQNLTLAIYQLIKTKVILFPDTIYTVPFIYKNISWFILYIQEIEFYFDFKYTNIIYDRDESDEDSGFINYKGTFYTSDYRGNKRKSIGIIYDKSVKDKKDNRISHKDIDSHHYPMRVEFRLHRNNCHYINLLNFMGTYFDIIKRFIPYLAVLYNVYFRNLISTSGKSNKQFNKIKIKSENGRVRYTGKGLKKSAPVPTEKSTRNEYGKKQIQRMILGQYFAGMKSDGNAEK
jgi:hypothetical protein